MINNNTLVTPLFGRTQLSITKLGLQGSPTSAFTTIITGGLISLQGRDLWGASKDLLLYIKPTTLRVTANGYAVITSRENVQKVIADFCETYSSYMEKYQKLNRFPMNGPVEIRVTGLDNPKDSIV